MPDPTTAIMWFRRDLRLSDNPALVEAARAADRVVALFVDDDRLRKPSGRNRLAFLAGCLAELDDSIGGRLVIRGGAPAKAATKLARVAAPRFRSARPPRTPVPHRRQRDGRLDPYAKRPQRGPCRTSPS